MLSFDITDRRIHIVKGEEARGSVKISTASTIDVSEGLVVNGHIKDIPKMATLINNELKSKNMADKEAVISISSNLVIFKELHIPKAKGNQLLTMIQNQMQHTMGIGEDYSISYTIAGEVEDEGVQALKVLATALPYDVIDCFKKVFSMLGIGLRSVAVACNTISRLILSDSKIKSKMPLLLVQIDASFLSLNLYENGQLTFSRFASIDPEDYEDSEDYIYEAVNENIFRMFQFQRSRSGGEAIQNVVFYGDTTEFIRLTNALEQMDIKTSMLGVPSSVKGYENIEFQSYANAIGAMFKTDKTIERINLLEIDASTGRSGTGSSFAAAVIIAMLISGAVVGAAFAYFQITINDINADIHRIEEELGSPQVLARINAVERAEKSIENLNLYSNELRAADEYYESHPHFTTEQWNDINDILRRNRAEWLEFSYAAGRVTLLLGVPQSTDPAIIAEAFVEQDIFDNIIYTGFNDVTDSEIPSVRYEFRLIFDIREAETEEASTPELASDTEEEPEPQVQYDSNGEVIS
ncbi:MAG: pilus assembly protein PilM [Oscillospiraceae bacterium]|nr:pilus assembly protein PilM [Oscillospiraceae bacterium]